MASAYESSIKQASDMVFYEEAVIQEVVASGGKRDIFHLAQAKWLLLLSLLDADRNDQSGDSKLSEDDRKEYERELEILESIVKEYYE